MKYSMDPDCWMIKIITKTINLEPEDMKAKFRNKKKFGIRDIVGREAKGQKWEQTTIY